MKTAAWILGETVAWLRRFVSSARNKQSMTSSFSPAAVGRSVDSRFLRAANFSRYRDTSRFSSNQALEPTADQRCAEIFHHMTAIRNSRGGSAYSR
jgi:hypothetical protein